MIDAVLDSYKFENDPQTGDSDYHLILKDASGNTMVGEIPFPECAQQSHFRDRITQSRSTFDSQFSATSSFQSAHDMPVRVTGIGFFDKTAHGEGHSPNGMEIHPILEIEFNPGPPQITPGEPTPSPTPEPTPAPPDASGGTGNLLVNGDFEKGDLGWTASPGVITNQGLPHGGFWVAWMGGLGTKHTDSLDQAVDIPASASQVTLSFWVHIDSDEVKAQVFDTLVVDLRADDGSVLRTLTSLSNRDENPHYERLHFDLSEFAGKRVHVHLVAKEDAARTTSFYLDTFRISFK